MDAPVRRRGRPRKEEKKRRGRPPNPDKLKAKPTLGVLQDISTILPTPNKIKETIDIFEETTSESKESDAVNEIEVSNFNVTENALDGTRKIQLSNLNNPEIKIAEQKPGLKRKRNKQLGSIKKIPFSNLKSVKKKHLGKAKPPLRRITMKLGRPRSKILHEHESSPALHKNEADVNSSLMVMQKPKIETICPSDSNLITVQNDYITIAEKEEAYLESDSTETEIPDEAEFSAMQSLLENSEQCVNNPSDSDISHSVSKDNRISQDIPPRMEVNLRKCIVLLRRLTEEEIYKSYPSDSRDEVNSDVKFKTEELLDKTVEAVYSDESQQYAYKRNGSKRSVRKPPNPISAAFEKYKRNREAYVKRKNRVSHSENGLDWSQDEVQTFSDGSTKAKKKVKKAHTKYERDFEWNPYSSKAGPYSPKVLRHRAKKIPVVESDSSTSDEDELLYKIYMEYGINDTMPSKNNNSTANMEYNLSDKKPCLDSESQKGGDILSGIINDMNELQKSRKVITKVAQDQQRLPQKSEMNSEKVVSSLLKDMVTKVSSKERCFDNRTKTDVKVCKCCFNFFECNQSTDVLCKSCECLGSEAESEHPSTKKKPIISGKIRPTKQVIKGKKNNSTMSQVLKKLPKSEKQRLIYAEKTDRLTIGKGYNHCKSFVTPKDSDKSMTNGDAKKNQNCVVLQKHNEGLFLMTFPDPDKELDFDNTLLMPQIIHNETSTKTLTKQNNEQSVIKSSKLQSDAKISEPIDPKKYDRYLFPPLPTVIVSNYCSDTSSLNLSHTYFQNQITQQHAVKTTKAPTRTNICAAVTASSVVHQNSSLPTNSLSNNSTITVTTLPICQGLSQIQFSTINTVPVINSQPSVPASNMTVLPVVSSVISLSDGNPFGKAKENVPKNFLPNNFVNSQQSGIRIHKVTSLKTFSKQNSVNMESSAKDNENRDSASDKLSKLAQSKRIDSVIIKPKKSDDLVGKRKRTSECSELLDMEEIKSPKHVKANTSNNSTNNQTSDISADNVPSGQSDSNNKENAAKCSDDNSNKENIAPQSAISSAIDMLDAISILAVIDLEKNPLCALNVRIQLKKNELDKLQKDKNCTPEHNQEIASCQYNLQLLNIAKRYLSLYGSFSKVSDHLLRKAQMIQIKKELHEEEMNQSACMFSHSSPVNNSQTSSQSDLLTATEITPVINQINNLNASRTNETATSSVSPIEKLKSQIAAMNNVNIDATQYSALSGSGTVHHYASEQIATLIPTVAAPTPVTPRNDCLMGESRETPSRGSGPRTPARPESAASQSEEQSLSQIKKEQFEAAAAATSPLSQCIYSQNTTLSQISSQLPAISEVPTLNIIQQPVVNTSVHLPVSNTNQVHTSQTNYNIQPSAIVSNRTVSYSNNQNYSNMLFNVTNKNGLQITPSTQNTDLRQSHPVILGQQIYQNGAGLCSKPAVPSISNNQYVIRQPYSTSNTSGTLIVNNTQGQNALLTNVSNQQFYTSNQVSQLYLPSAQQITYMANNTISNMLTQDVTATQMQQSEIESPEQMLCAVCNSQATLRCKQCARVAYCNTTCAKTYWHQKHKMECKPLGS